MEFQIEIISQEITNKIDEISKEQTKFTQMASNETVEYEKLRKKVIKWTESIVAEVKNEVGVELMH